MAKRWHISQEVISSKIENEAVLMSMKAGMYFSLDPVGSQIWEMLSKKSASTEELTSLLMEEYDIDKETCTNDVQSFINEMVSKTLIIPVEE